MASTEEQRQFVQTLHALAHLLDAQTRLIELKKPTPAPSESPTRKDAPLTTLWPMLEPVNHLLRKYADLLAHELHAPPIPAAKPKPQHQSAWPEDRPTARKPAAPLRLESPGLAEMHAMAS